MDGVEEDGDEDDEGHLDHEEGLTRASRVDAAPHAIVGDGIKRDDDDELHAHGVGLVVELIAKLVQNSATQVLLGARLFNRLLLLNILMSLY